MTSETFRAAVAAEPATDKSMPENRERSRDATIGNLNGGWAAMFRLALVLAPIATTAAIAHATWATRAIFVLQADVQSHRQEPWHGETGKEIATLRTKVEVVQLDGPKWLKEQLSAIERRGERMEAILFSLTMTGPPKPVNP